MATEDREKFDAHLESPVPGQEGKGKDPRKFSDEEAEADFMGLLGQMGSA